jgi:hypothetical protein
MVDLQELSGIFLNVSKFKIPDIPETHYPQFLHMLSKVTDKPASLIRA